MARRGTQLSLNPVEQAPVQAAPDPIVNRPFDEPLKHWIFQQGIPKLQLGRRPASYYYTTKKVGTAQLDMYAEEQRDELELVNHLRADVKRWRESGYRGASQVTKELFRHWNSPDRNRRLFFCQREAVETVIYLLELGLTGRLVSSGFKNFEVSQADLAKLVQGERVGYSSDSAEWAARLSDPSSGAGPHDLVRLGCKMATGSGKTVVMSMIIAWAFCNRARNPQSDWFPRGVLVCAPNLTVRERLQVLKPKLPGNYYDAFDIVPRGLREALNHGEVLVTNWHTLALKNEHSEGGTAYKVVNKGAEPPDAFTRDRIGELVNRMPILVLNDEGHHCWRPKANVVETTGLTPEQKKALEDETEEARVWFEGLDRINNSGLLPKDDAGKPRRGVLACVDLSATPFFLAGSGHPAGSPFPWLVSDFGLVDAIESGIVKIPRLPVQDDLEKKDDAGRPDPKYFALWRHIAKALTPSDIERRRPKPEALYREAEGALKTLGSQWRSQFNDEGHGDGSSNRIQPVMIVVCDNTDLAKLVYRHISGEHEEDALDEDGKPYKRTVYGDSTLFPELANAPGLKRTVRIDSKLLNALETTNEQNRDEAALALRRLIDTVGKRNEPGEHIRCVVSVSMLTEGWDASNVTHILGIRAFESQLLCEQVVGRGLRRRSYDVNKEGFLEAEYVDVYGIPFTLIPFKGKPKTPGEPDPVVYTYESVDERAAHAIRVPNVQSYVYDVRNTGIECDIDELAEVHVQSEPTRVYLRVPKGMEDTGDLAVVGEFIEQDRSEFLATVRLQQIVFRLAQLIVDDLVSGGSGPNAEKMKKTWLARHQIYPDVVRIVQEYIRKKVKFLPDVDPRELALEKYARLVRERLLDGIKPAAASKESPLKPVLSTYEPYLTTEGLHGSTRIPVFPVQKCHLDVAPMRSIGKNGGIGERVVADLLDELDFVESYAPNVRELAFEIAYEHNGHPHKYEPDFVVRLRGGRMVVLEVKGAKGELHDTDKVQAKNAAARKWVAAVSNLDPAQPWSFLIGYTLAEIRHGLEALAAPAPTTAKVLPFRWVDEPPKAERWKSCVPLMSLRAAASKWSEEQTSLIPVEEAAEWVTWDEHPRFEPGMFIARVVGRSMEPEIPDGAYCLFRPSSIEAVERTGRPALVRYQGENDPHTGGQFSVKRVKAERIGNGGHERVVRIELRPENPDFPAWTIEGDALGHVGVVAEVVAQVGGTRK